MAHDFFRLGHSPGTAPLADRQRSFGGLQYFVTESSHVGDVSLCLRVRPHPIVHRRYQKNFRRSGEKARGKKIVGEPVSRAADEVCRSRSYNYEIGFARQPDVIQRVAGTKDFSVNRPASNRFESDRSNELARSASHYYIDFGAGLCKQTRQPH